MTLPFKRKTETPAGGYPGASAAGSVKTPAGGNGNGRGGAPVPFFACVTLALLILMALSMGSGSVRIPPADILRILMSGGDGSPSADIVLKIRAPRVMAAALFGGALALSGYLLQVFFGNPIAGPFVLGISSGAKTCVALAMIVLIGSYRQVPSSVLVLAAFAGSAAATGFIILVSRRVRHMASLLVAGIMTGYLCSAATDFLITFADDADIVNLHGWSEGSFAGMTMEGVGTGALICGAGLLFAVLLAKPIGAYQMGERYARSVGVNIRFFRAALILVSGMLSACVTAFAGPVSFIGIAVPFLTRRILRTQEPLVMIPAVVLAGGLACVICDLIARTAFAPLELYIGTVTSLFGAPVVIFMLVTRRRETG